MVESSVKTKGDGFVIEFPQCEGNIYIEPSDKDKDQADKWVEHLSKIINETEGKQKRRSYIIRKNPSSFYKTCHVLNEEFEKCANSGDILLFRSPHSAASLQRTFTNSEYDHVGVVLRNQKNEIFIFESTSQEGVGLTPWRHMINYEWYDQTEKISWRILNMDLSSRDVEVIEAFVAKTLGKGFEISLDKLFKFKSTLQRTTEEEKDKTYFCSELVARLYKELGILDSNTSSTSYYPVDFSSKGGLKIVKPGVSLSPEVLISFDK